MAIRCGWFACLLAAAILAITTASVPKEDTQYYKDSGQVLTRRLLDQSAIEHLAARLESLLLQNGRRAFGEEQGQKEVRFTFAVHELDAKVASFIRNRTGELWQAAAQLAGTKELCVLMDRGFSKDPGDPETHWHRDDEAIGLHQVHPGLRTVHAWIPLRAMGRDMGTLQYLVGTHRRVFGWLENFLASLWGWEFAWFMTAAKVQDDGLEVGDVAWHDGWVLHSAGANSGMVVRDGLAVSFAFCNSPDGCGGSAAPMSAVNTTCRIAAWLFDSEWRARHRDGENDYSKNLIQEPVLHQVARFAWRSVVGGAGGLLVHWIAVNGCCRKRKEA